MEFKGISRVFSTIGNDQYNTIGEFGMNYLKSMEWKI